MQIASSTMRLVAHNDLAAQPEATKTAEGPGPANALVQQVDFPSFVAGLIHGVFHAIVDSSRKQMEAYGDLVQSADESRERHRKDP